MKQKGNKAMAWRMLFYSAGLVILAIGITLNTKTGLGVSPIISIPFTISAVWDWNFGLVTFCVYSSFVALQFLLKGNRRRLADLLQIPFSIVFSVLLNYFGIWLDVSFDRLWENLLLLLAAIGITAVGVSLTVNMKWIPNPADGLAQAVGEAMGKGLGFGKNVIDIASVVISLLIGIAAAKGTGSIGIGTLLAMLGVGRCIALFNHFFKKKMELLSGLSQDGTEPLQVQSM